MRIAVLVPTYKRSEKLADFVRKFNGNAILYFIVTPEDKDSQIVLSELKQNYFVHDSEYVGAINYGFKETKEEFVVCASDDVVFREGWDEVLLKMADENPDKHIFGGIDEWKVTFSLKYISHPLVRRSHFASPLYFPGYIHYMCDTEFIQRGWMENSVMITPQVLISHPHTITDGEDPTKWDKTYQRSFSKIEIDKSLYDRRKGEFEMYDFDELQKGRVAPTKLNPEYNKVLVSMVIPTYNDADFLIGCLESLAENTYYRFEVIIINNGSDKIQKTKEPWYLIDTDVLLKSFQFEDQSCKIRVINYEKNKFINPAWNHGAELAEGQYVAFLNADIELSKDWDKYLISALEKPSRPYTVACPYEINPHTNKPFALDKLFMKYAPNMLKGQSFLMRKSDVPKIFPIPEPIKHWCGDNWIADKSEGMNGTVFVKKAVVYHYITQSGGRMNATKLSERCYKDILAYEKVSGKDMGWLKSRFPDSIRLFIEADADKYKNPHSN
jgi:glycosyltransferase involved in cell wall biosynthesis